MEECNYKSVILKKKLKRGSEDRSPEVEQRSIALQRYKKTDYIMKYIMQ